MRHFYTPPRIYSDNSFKYISGHTIEGNIPYNCLTIINKLEEAGYDAFVVGGCLRDVILRKQPNDFDLATSATPEQMKEVLSEYESYDTGIKHGTITFKIGGSFYEVTTFRSDGDYVDSRHPSSVKFVSTIEDDLSRRDFTMNAIAWNPRRGIVDPFDGVYDIEHKFIRCVGDPDKRFEEDLLRVVRALRFSCCLGFEIEPDTENSIHKYEDHLNKISRERVFSEIIKMFSTGSPRSLCSIIEKYNHLFSNIFNCVEIEKSFNFDQNNKYHDRDLLTHTLDVVYGMPAKPELRIAALFHDLGKVEVVEEGEDGCYHYPRHWVKSKEIAEKSLRSLNVSNNFLNEILFLVENHDAKPSPTRKSCRKFIVKSGSKERTYNLLYLMIEDARCHAKEFAEHQVKELDKIFYITSELFKEEELFSIKDLNVNGHDLINLGYEGKEIGNCLNELLNAVINEEVENNKKDLINYIITPSKFLPRK